MQNISVFNERLEVSLVSKEVDLEILISTRGIPTPFTDAEVIKISNMLIDFVKHTLDSNLERLHKTSEYSASGVS